MRRDERRTTQRERLLDGMLAAVAREGYAGATVSRVIANAGVSRPTFYEYFPDRDACFLATHERAARGLLEYVREGVLEEEPRQAFRGAACALLRHAEEQRDASRLLGDQALAAGSRALDARDAALARLARVVEEALGRAEPDASAPDLPALVLLGGLQRSLAAWLRNSALDAAALARELTELLASFERPLREHRRRALRPGPPLAPSPHVATLALQAPRPLPPGRSRASHAEIERNQRERILFATAAVASERGYGATAVSDILAAARVDRRVFYAHFRDRQDAFLAAHELAFPHAMGVAASAYFGSESWPERIWEGIRATTQFYDTYVVFGYLGFVEAHAVGPAAIRRVDDHRMAFTVFLQEGNQHTRRLLSSTAMEAVASAIFEIGYIQIRARRGRPWELSRYTPLAAHIALTPFIGVAAAGEAIDALQARAERAQPA